MRKEARNNKDMTFTSARTLLAILRLSTALVGLFYRQRFELTFVFMADGVFCVKFLLMVFHIGVWGRDYIDGFVQERRNSSAMELRLSCTNPLSTEIIFIRKSFTIQGKQKHIRISVSFGH